MELNYTGPILYNDRRCHVMAVYGMLYCNYPCPVRGLQSRWSHSVLHLVLEPQCTLKAYKYTQ